MVTIAGKHPTATLALLISTEEAKRGRFAYSPRGKTGTLRLPYLRIILDIVIDHGTLPLP